MTVGGQVPRIPAQRTAELRRAADHLEARAEVADRQALGGTEADRREHHARANQLRSTAAVKRAQADAVDHFQQEAAQMTVPDPLSPDCEQRKHTACTGEAWDFLRDEPASCTCHCHRQPADREVRR
jgi:hypothetical protein